MKSTPMIKKEAAAALFGRWGKSMLIFLCILLMTLVSSAYPFYFPDIEKKLALLIEFIITFLIIQPLQMGATVFLLKLVRKEPVSPGMIFDGYQYLKKLLPLSILFFAVSVVSQKYLDFILPMVESGESGIYSIILYSLISLTAVILLSQVQFLICDNPEWSGLKSIVRGVILIIKNLIPYIALQLSFLLWIIASLFSGGILLIWVVPYMETAGAVFYEEIKDVK